MLSFTVETPVNIYNIFTCLHEIDSQLHGILDGDRGLNVKWNSTNSNLSQGMFQSLFNVLF